MRVRDLLFSPDFDVNCRCMIYKCGEDTWREGDLVLDTGTWDEPTPQLLDSKIKYITISENCRLIVEV